LKKTQIVFGQQKRFAKSPYTSLEITESPVFFRIAVKRQKLKRDANRFSAKTICKKRFAKSFYGGKNT